MTLIISNKSKQSYDTVSITCRTMLPCYGASKIVAAITATIIITY